MELIEISEKDYKTYLNESAYKNFLAHPAIGKHRNNKIIYLGLSNGDKLIGAAKILVKSMRFKQTEFYIPGGLIIDYKDKENLNEFLMLLKDFAKKQKAFNIKIEFYVEKVSRDINGNITDSYNNYDVVKTIESNHFVKCHDDQPRWMHVIDIENKTYPELEKNMSQNTRNCINKTHKYAITTSKLKRDELDEFVKITDDTSKRKDFSNKSLNYYEKMYDYFENDVMYLKAELDVNKYRSIVKEEISQEEISLNKLDRSKEHNKGKIEFKESLIIFLNKRLEHIKDIKTDHLTLSVGMFILYGDEIVYLFSGSDEEYMKLFAQYQIQQYIIEYATKHNYKRYNFYGISGVFDKSDPKYGIYLFKKGFGGHVVENIGAYEYPINKFVYKILNLRK